MSGIESALDVRGSGGMRAPWLGFKSACLAFALALVAVVAAPQAPALADDGAAVWSVSQVSGSVKARADAGAAWHALQMDEVLRPSAEVESGADGRAVLTHEGTTMRVSPNSSFALPSNESIATGVYRIVETFGSVLYRVKKRAESLKHFEVQTPFLAAVVKGTTFNVDASAIGDSVHVIEGIVGVRSRTGGGDVTILGGETARVGAMRGSNPVVSGKHEQKSQTDQAPAKAKKAADDGAKSHGKTVVVIEASDVPVGKRHPHAVPIFTANSGNGIFAKGVTVDTAFGNDSSNGKGKGNDNANHKEDLALLSTGAVDMKSGDNGGGNNGNGSGNAASSGNGASATSLSNGNANGNAIGLNSASSVGSSGSGNANGIGNGNGNGVGGGLSGGATADASAGMGNNGNGLGGGSSSSGAGLGNSGNGMGGGNGLGSGSGGNALGGGNGGGLGSGGGSGLGGGSAGGSGGGAALGSGGAASGGSGALGGGNTLGGGSGLGGGSVASLGNGNGNGNAGGSGNGNAGGNGNGNGKNK